MAVKSLLLVDDDANLRLITQMSLEDVGSLNVTGVPSGSDALKVLSQREFDVILLDVMMPGMDGIETLRKMKNQFPNLPPVIFLTAKIQRHEMTSYLNLGAAGVITKPFDPMTLAHQVVEIAEKHAISRASAD